jgi:hypothetical protein
MMRSVGPETPLDSPLTMDEVLASDLYRDLSTPKLSTGDPAYLFELTRLEARDGGAAAAAKPTRLADYVGSRPVALVFGSYT